MPRVRAWHGRMRAIDGALLSLMNQPLGNENTQLVSAVVYGLGSRRGSKWSLGRMEWLALELVLEARHVLLERWGDADCALWSVLDEQFKCSRRDLHLSFAFAPHKMRLTGGELESSAPGAGERADVLLLAWPSQSEDPTVLGWAYHTTNVPPGTSSNRSEQAYPESRVLWRHCTPLPHLVNHAARSLALRLDMPVSASIDSLDNPEVWRTPLLSASVDSLDNPEASDDDSESVYDAEY